MGHLPRRPGQSAVYLAVLNNSAAVFCKILLRFLLVSPNALIALLLASGKKPNLYLLSL